MITYSDDFNLHYQQFISDIEQSISASSQDEIRHDLSIIFSCIDNTTLNGDDTESKVSQFCKNTINNVLHVDEKTIGVSSVCVFPSFTKLVKNELRNTAIKTATVAGCFPSGQSSPKIKLDEVMFAVDEGTDEVDFVINRGLFLSGLKDCVFDEIAAAKRICGDLTLKVILETGELGSPENIYHSALIAMEAGADFVKTSTGKIATGATYESAFTILTAINDFNKKQKKCVGFKASGGISDPMDALFYYRMTKKIFNDLVVDKHNFRIGASRLTNKILNILTV